MISGGKERDQRHEKGYVPHKLLKVPFAIHLGLNLC